MVRLQQGIGGLGRWSCHTCFILQQSESRCVGLTVILVAGWLLDAHVCLFEGF